MGNVLRALSQFPWRLPFTITTLLRLAGIQLFNCDGMGRMVDIGKGLWLSDLVCDTKSKAFIWQWDWYHFYFIDDGLLVPALLRGALFRVE